jgi:hypothetical protein
MARKGDLEYWQKPKWPWAQIGRVRVMKFGVPDVGFKISRHGVSEIG